MNNNTINGNGFFGDLVNDSGDMNIIGGAGILATNAGATSVMNLTMDTNEIADNGYLVSAENNGLTLDFVGGFGIGISDSSSSLSTCAVTNNTVERNGFIAMMMGGVTSTPGSNLRGLLTSGTGIACFDINGNTFDADFTLDNQAGGTFQVIDLNNLGTNNTGGSPTFAPGISSFTDVTGH